MRSALIFLFVLFAYFPTSADARTAMNRCFEDHGTHEAALFACMKKEYDKREHARVTIETEIINIVNKHESDSYHSLRKEDDLESLIKGREIFEAYRKLECDRLKNFLERSGPKATFDHMVCLFDMTTQRIRTLQNSVKE